MKVPVGMIQTMSRPSIFALQALQNKTEIGATAKCSWVLTLLDIDETL